MSDDVTEKAADVLYAEEAAVFRSECLAMARALSSAGLLAGGLPDDAGERIEEVLGEIEGHWRPNEVAAKVLALFKSWRVPPVTAPLGNVQLPDDFAEKITPFLIGARPLIEARNYEEVSRLLDEALREVYNPFRDAHYEDCPAEKLYDRDECNCLEVARALAVETAPRTLADVLALIEKHDTDYTTRYGLVFEAVHLAIAEGYMAGIGLDPAQPEWPVIYIELPAGQVSWHVRHYPEKWDGHTTEEKYRRIREFRAAATTTEERD